MAESNDEIKPLKEEETTTSEPSPPPPPAGGGGGGWGGWGFSPLSYLSDLQKAASVAADEISRNAVEVAKTAAKSLSEMPDAAEDSESSKEDDVEASAVEKESEDENEKRRMAALDKLEKASEDSFLGQGLKALDDSVESFASGAWKALGSALKGGSNLVNKLENSAANIDNLPGNAGSVAPSLIETGRAFTSKGMEVLELLGKETMDLLISETGLAEEKSSKGAKGKVDDDQLFEEVTFDRCFYIYGGPEQLEELEALSNHYAMLFNRRKVKLSSDQRSIYDGKLKQVQQIFDFNSEFDGSNVESEKGKKVETGTEGSNDEMKNLHDSSVSKAAELAAGFTNAIAGLSPGDIIQRTTGRLESLHSEGVHRLSEMCCFAVTHILMLGKSIISSVNKGSDQEIDVEIVKIDWPEDAVERAKIIRKRAESMVASVEAVSHSFITGISDVAEAYAAAVKSTTSDANRDIPQKSIQEKANTSSETLRANHSTSVGKIQDGLQYLSYVVLSTSMPAA